MYWCIIPMHDIIAVQVSHKRTAITTLIHCYTHQHQHISKHIKKHTSARVALRRLCVRSPAGRHMTFVKICLYVCAHVWMYACTCVYCYMYAGHAPKVHLFAWKLMFRHRRNTSTGNSHKQLMSITPATPAQLEHIEANCL